VTLPVRIVKSPGRWNRPNNISAARQFTRVYGDNPEAVQLMADHQLGRLKAEGIDPRTGLLREGAVDKFLAKNREILDALPPQVRAAVTPSRNIDTLHGRIGDLDQQARIAGNPRTLGQIDPEVTRLQQQAETLDANARLAANSKGARTLDPALEEMHQRLGQLEQRQRAVAEANIAGLLGRSPERTIDVAMNDWQIMKSLKRSVVGDPANEAALTRAIMDRAPDPANAGAFREWLAGHDRVLRQVLTPEHLADLQKIARASEILNRAPAPKGTAQLPKSMAGKFADVTGNSLPGIVASATNVERGRSNRSTSSLRAASRYGVASISVRSTPHGAKRSRTPTWLAPRRARSG